MRFVLDSWIDDIFIQSFIEFKFKKKTMYFVYHKMQETFKQIVKSFGKSKKLQRIY